MSPTPKSHDYNRLISLGIPAEVLEQANISEGFYKYLFILKFPISFSFASPLKIDAPWQLQILTGQMNAISLNSRQQDNLGATFSHYAAWSGKPEALQWVADKQPELLTKIDRCGETIAHYAAKSGNPEALQWVADKQPELLTKIAGITIAHYAAWSGNPEAIQWVAEKKPELLTKKVNRHQTIAHFAAWSGNPEALQWVADKQPELLSEKAYDNETIAHYAAWSGNPEALQWVADMRPELLTEKDENGKSIAHYAAHSGNPKALQWVADMRPELLTEKDNHGETIAHYAAHSGNPEALQWVAELRPDLLTEDYIGATYSGNTEQWGMSVMLPVLFPHKIRGNITHFAARSGNPESLNKALSLSETPGSFVIPKDIRNKTRIINVLLRALDNNFTLTEVVTPKLNKEIAAKLTRNLEIEKARQDFLVFAQGFYQETSQVSDLITPNILFEIFKRLMPNEVPKEQARHIFHRIMHTASPEGMPLRLLNHKQKAASDILNTFAQGKLTPSRGNLFHKIGLMETNEAKVKILTDIKAIINKEHGSLDAVKQSITDYCDKNKKVIDHQRNKIHTFFSPSHKTTTRMMVEEIFIALDINKTDISVSTPHRSV